MPAKVTIQSGISAGTSYWIERAVVRVGSDPKSDLCLPSANVPSHALTLEFRDGRYRIHNRCQVNVFVGTRVVEPGNAIEWPDTDILQLNNEIELVLDVEEDPSPKPMRTRPNPGEDLAGLANSNDWQQESEDQDIERGDGDVADKTIDSDNSADTSTNGSNLLLQLAVIVFCILGSVGMLARESIKQSTSDTRKPPSFTEVVRNANTSASSPILIQRLQYAESAAIRGNASSAQERFGELRDDLVPQRAVFAEAGRDAELAILDFVEYRLGQLER